MKEKYTTPTVEITMFHTEDIITVSSPGSADSASMPFENVPPVLDGNDVFYN